METRPPRLSFKLLEENANKLVELKKKLRAEIAAAIALSGGANETGS